MPYTSEHEEGGRQGSSEAVGVGEVVVLIIAGCTAKHLTSWSSGQANCSPWSVK